MRQEPKPFERYRHFKGKEYQILMLAYSEADDSKQVIYQALYGDYKIYVRPLDSFMSETDREKYPDACQKYRFEKIEPQPVNEDKDTIQKIEPQPVKAEKNNIEKTDSGVNDFQMEEPDLDPAVIEYLDAETNEARLNILTGVHHRITEEMITTMSIATDFEVAEGDIEQQYQELKNCLLMKIKFEKVR